MFSLLSVSRRSVLAGGMGLLALGGALVVNGPARAEPDGHPLQAFVPIPPVKSFVSAVGGDRVRVDALVPAGSDPHTYEPTPSQMTALANAGIYFTLGLPFEHKLLARLESLNEDVLVVDVTARIRKLAGGHHHHHDHDEHADTHDQHDHESHAGEEDPHDHHDHDHDHEDGDHGHDDHDHAKTTRPGGDAPLPAHMAWASAPATAFRPGDPHVWTAPPYVRLMADEIRHGLTRIDPAHKAVYQKGYGEFVRNVAALDREVIAYLWQGESVTRTTFLVYHPAWRYYANAYGLREVALEHEGKTPSPRRLKEIIDQAQVDKVTTVFVEPQFPRKKAEAVAQALDAKVAVIDPLAEDWMRNTTAVTRQLRDALR